MGGNKDFEFVVKNLRLMQRDLEKVLKRSEKLAKKIDVPSYAELYFITEEVGQLLEMATKKEKNNEQGRI